MDLKGKYGLIIPAKEREANAKAAANPTPRRRNVFGDVDSDSEPDEDTDWVKKTMKKQNHGSIQQKQSVQAIKQALSDDPTVYQYDELYDEMEKKRENTKESNKKDRKAKYIEKLLKTAELRKHEDEARTERLVQKEREKEGDTFKDKEAFVTGAYRKKMEELERVKEEERRRDQLDAIVDVTKQNDLSGFYRHLYRQQICETEPKPTSSPKNSLENDTNQRETSSKRMKMDVETEFSVKGTEETAEAEELGTEELPDREFSPLRETKERIVRFAAEVQETETGDRLSPSQEENVEVHGDILPTPGNSEQSISSTSIWTKRTVGSVLEEALARYFQRKQANTLQASTVEIA